MPRTKTNKTQFVVMTVGKTHAGKSTFCAKLLPKLKNTVIVEADPISSFLNKYHKEVYQLGDGDANFRTYNKRKLHYSIWKTIIDHALHRGYNILLPNAALVRSWRAKVIRSFRKKGAKVVIIFFDIPDSILRDRIKKAKREKSMLTVSKDFYQLLDKQNKYLYEEPKKSEADCFFRISSPKDYDKISNSVAKLINKPK